MTKDDLDKIPIGQVFRGIKSEDWEIKEQHFYNEEVPWEKLFVKVRHLCGTEIICRVDTEIKLREKTVEEKVVDKIKSKIQAIEEALTIEEQKIFASYFVSRVSNKR